MSNQVITQTSKEGLNKYKLLNTASEEFKQAYEAVFEIAEGSLTTVSDNDAAGKIRVAMNLYSPNEEQVRQLQNFLAAFKAIESQIDPEKLSFFITKATDDEICINRTMSSGISKLIIHDDGLIAYSYISYTSDQSKDELTFYATDQLDFESLSYQLFA